MEENRVSTGQNPNLLKKTYTTPILTKIHLEAEEAVLGLCKRGTGAPGVQAGCAPDPACISGPRS
jgi:hypothetical protein